MELPNTLAIDIRNVGAQQANPVKKLGNMPIKPLYLQSKRHCLGKLYIQRAAVTFIKTKRPINKPIIMLTGTT